MTVWIVTADYGCPCGSGAECLTIKGVFDNHDSAIDYIFYLKNLGVEAFWEKWDVRG